MSEAIKLFVEGLFSFTGKKIAVDELDSVKADMRG